MTGGAGHFVTHPVATTDGQVAASSIAALQAFDVLEGVVATKSTSICVVLQVPRLSQVDLKVAVQAGHPLAAVHVDRGHPFL